MKNFNRIFRDAERLQPTKALWRKIESEVAMEGSLADSASTSVSTYYKLAASVVLAAGLLASGMFLQHRHGSGQVADAKPSLTETMAAAAAAETDTSGISKTYLVDSDLLVWAADLGELDLDAEESAEEVL